jgi:hypothetical protein
MHIMFMATHNGLLFKVLSNITVAISIDKLSCSRLNPAVWVRPAVRDIGGNVVTREPPDLHGSCCQPRDVDAALVGVEALAVGARRQGVTASGTTVVR